MDNVNSMDTNIANLLEKKSFSCFIKFRRKRIESGFYAMAYFLHPDLPHEKR
jgi:hypothetical protein